MKKIFLTLSSLLALFAAEAQNNPNANPYVLGINAATSPIEVGQTTTVTFDLGNNGSSPIPAGGARFNVSFPPNVTVGQASLNMAGGEGLFAATWNVIPGNGTYLQLNVVGAGIPAFIFNGPQTAFHMTVQITGATAGSALQQSINAEPLPAVAQNANSGDDNAFGPIQVVPAGTLPVQLVSFTGRLADEHTARLNWEISDPEKFSHFELERSANGLDFSKVTVVALSAQHKYQYDDDISGLQNKILYRLRMVDQDGSSSLSDIVPLTIKGIAKEFFLYPNPATGKVSIGGVAGNVGYTIYTLEGRPVKTGTCSTAGTDIDVATFSAGAYWVKITSPDQVQTLKLVKQ